MLRNNRIGGVIILIACLTIFGTQQAHAQSANGQDAHGLVQAFQLLNKQLDPYRSKYPQKPGEDSLGYVLRLLEIDKCEGANNLVHINQLPYMKQTYGICFGVTASQIGDYLRLEAGQTIHMPSKQEIAALMVDRLNGKAAPTDSTFPTSFFVSALDSYAAKANGNDLTILDSGGYMDSTLDQMSRSGGCALSMYELMPDGDRRIFVEELGRKFAILDSISSLPPEEAWSQFKDNFKADFSMAPISIDEFQGRFDPAKWPKLQSTIKDIRFALEQAACPSRNIQYPPFNIDKKEYSEPSIFGSKPYNEILKWLKTEKRPVPIDFCSRVIEDSSFKGLDIGINRVSTDDCQRHTVLVVGAKYFEDTNQCKIKIRNWWGANYNYPKGVNPDGKGNLYLNENEINSNVFRSYFIQLKDQIVDSPEKGQTSTF